MQFDHGFVLHRPVGAWKSTLPVGDVGLTTSRDILEAMAAGDGPREHLVALGYAGWAAGQIEDEILRNGWLTGGSRPQHDLRPAAGRRATARR